MNKLLEKLVILASHYIGEHFDNCKPLLDKDFDEIHPTMRFVPTQLYISCHLSSQSALLLAKELQEWDCELIMRSVVEGVTKYAYLLDGGPIEVIGKAHEYWDLLPNYASVKRSERAKVLIETVKGQNDKKWKSIADLVLTSEETQRLRGNTNKTKRSQLEQKWSFSEIIRKFAQSDDSLLRDFVGLSYSYGNSSHLIHKDGDGIAMIWERDTREPERKEAVKKAHLARIVSDVCYFALMRSYFLYKFCDKKDTFIAFSRELEIKYSELFKELAECTESFNDTEYGT